MRGIVYKIPYRRALGLAAVRYLNARANAGRARDDRVSSIQAECVREQRDLAYKLQATRLKTTNFILFRL